jgi:glycerophosphoryl diester phosphodiesterase
MERITRFIILDPNGEYSNSFDKLCNIRKFRVKIDDHHSNFKQLRVPAWMWNSYEWSSVTQASGKTQRPLLRRALRELRNDTTDEMGDEKTKIRRYFSSSLISIKNDLNQGLTAYADFPGKQNFGEKIESLKCDVDNFINQTSDGTLKSDLQIVKNKVQDVLNEKPRNRNYFPSFDRKNLEYLLYAIQKFLSTIGGIFIYEGPNEDSPVPFNGQDLPNHLERLAQEQNVLQYVDFLIMRIRTMLSDQRMNSIIGTDDESTLENWLNEYVGANNSENGEIALIDLSLVPADVIHLVVAVISRIIFEALQRYHRINGKELPTVLILEEAHTFIKRYIDDSDQVSPERMCCQTFERIAREGRKFGLGLVISSQRPSELSPTVLSQCNTYLLHRIVNDRDQELVKRLVPDNLGDLLKELPVLPTRKAILLGWAAPIPILVEMRELKKIEQPRSSDPSFWDVWLGREERTIDWGKIIKDWTK